MEEETSALLAEIIRSSSTPGLKPLSAEAKSGGWQSLAPAYFKSVGSFVSLGREAIVEYWEPSWQDPTWDSMNEPWRRLLVRLFVSAKWLEQCDKLDQDQDTRHDLEVRRSTLSDLLDVMIMAGQDSGVARLMLQARFGESLSGEYQRLPAYWGLESG